MRVEVYSLSEIGADDGRSIVTIVPIRPKPTSNAEALQRYPRLTAHLVCHSLGYFSPEGAAGAVLSYINRRPNYCEWYYHMCGLSRRWKELGRHPTQQEWDSEMLAIGQREIRRASDGRHQHQGYMADYRLARALVDHVRQGGQGPLLASWM